MDEQWNWDPRWGHVKPPEQPDWEVSFYNQKYMIFGKVNWLRRKLTNIVLGVKWRKIK